MGKTTVLLAVPDGGYVAAVISQLCSRHVEVITAFDVPHAIDLLSKCVPDLVITHLTLPGGGGIRVHQFLQSVGHGATPFIYLAPAEPALKQERQAASDLDPAAVIDLPIAAAQLVHHAARYIKAAKPVRTFRTQAKFRVLIVEDDPVQREAIGDCLNLPGREPIEVTFATTVREACELLRGLRYDCVLLDHMMGDGCGSDVLEQADNDLVTTPVIGLSGSADPQTMIKYFRSGCTEFLSKREAMQLDHLRRRITEVVSQFQRRTMMIILERSHLSDSILQSQESFVAMARKDQLTGISNRAVFDDAMLQWHARSVRDQQPWALCMIDVDRFKQYNDHFGHAAGDETLRAIAQSLEAGMRESDLASRIGGEEFAALLDMDDVAAALHASERLRERVFAASIKHPLNPPHGVVTISIGVAMFNPARPLSPDAFLRAADRAMYRAKSLGRNCVAVAEELSADCSLAASSQFMSEARPS